MRILLTGGGTAGHINPAIAIAEIIKQNAPHAVIAFVGTPNGMENRLVGEVGYPLYHVRVRGFSRSLSPRNLLSLYYALTSPYAAAKILAEFRPDLVIGTGGYVCWPVLAAAAKAGIPRALHESNALPGLTTRKLARRMDALWLNFEESSKHPALQGAHCLCTGNPLRRGFSTVSRDRARAALGLAPDCLFLLSFGGSGGAAAVNEACLGADGELLRHLPQFYHVHACGTRYYDECLTKYALPEEKRLRYVPYLDKMPLYMGAADIVVCRAGAMTLSELSLCGKCAILVPSPNVTDNHQYKNAALLAEAGAAVLLEEKQLSPASLCDKILSLAASPDTRHGFEEKIKNFAHPDSGKILWREIRRLCAKKVL